jgi:predicted nucleotidyltransferase
MKTPALTSEELVQPRRVFARHPEVKTVRLFGSRAKGAHAANSDIDLAL